MCLEAENIHFHYPGGQVMADGIDFSLKPGQFTILLGPNGCGKSTLLRILTGELLPDRGEVRLDGKPVRAYSGRERARKIGVMLQNLPSALDFTVEELVTLGRSPHLPLLSAPGEQDRQQIVESMDYYGVTGLRKRLCSSLSGGERQRVMLAAIRANDPEILLLDEPTSAADPAQVQFILSSLREMSRNRTVFMISHDLMQTANYADRILLMKQGKILADGAPVQVLTAANLRRLYDIEFQVFSAAGGRMAFLPGNEKEHKEWEN